MGTPDQGATPPSDYDKAYQAEMEKLEAEAAAKATTPDEPNLNSDPNTPTANGEPTPTPAPTAAPAGGEANPLEARIAQLEQQLASTSKALNDTKSWATQSREELKRLKREREEQERLANRPRVLDDNPGLEDAIRHVTGAPAPGQKRHDPDEWAATVGSALPGLDALLEQNPDLAAKAQAKAQELGESWTDPIVAIRELGALQLEHERNRMAAVAQEAARRDFQQRQQKQTAMQMPGAGGGNSRPNQQPRDDAGRWATMSSADFAKERARVMGH